MRRFIFDTGIAGDYLDRRYGVYERACQETAAGNTIGIAISGLAELAYGIEFSATRGRNMQQLRRSLAGLKIWPFTDAAAMEYGRIAAELRRAGRQMQTMDMVLASITLTLGKCTVVTTDSDLLAVPGLQVVNWRH